MTPNPSEPPTLSGGARGRIGPQTAQLSPGHLPASEQAQRPRSHSAGCPRGQAALRGPRRPGPTSPRVLPLAAGQRTQRFSNQGLDTLRGHSPGLLTQRVWEEPPRCLHAKLRSLTAPPTPRGRRESAGSLTGGRPAPPALRPGWHQRKSRSRQWPCGGPTVPRLPLGHQLGVNQGRGAAVGGSRTAGGSVPPAVQGSSVAGT